MTTNDATPREALARCMTSGFSRRVWDGNFNPSPDSEYNNAVRDHVRSDYLNDADRIIAHLWRRGTDWNTTVVKVACILEGEVKCDVHPESYHNKLEEMADEIVATLLTALLGDRPTELESHDE